MRERNYEEDALALSRSQLIVVGHAAFFHHNSGKCTGQIESSPDH